MSIRRTWHRRWPGSIPRQPWSSSSPRPSPPRRPWPTPPPPGAGCTPSWALTATPTWPPPRPIWRPAPPSAFRRAAWSASRAGAAMDDHFRAAPLAANAPVLLALANVFNRNGLGRPARVVEPYAERLGLLASYLQQLEMESNGKRVTLASEPVTHATATAVFGNAGTNDQHAFFQMLHQGTDVIPVDFVAVAKAEEGPRPQQAILLANAIAQAEALMTGQANAAEPHRHFPGDRPSSFILMDRLTPKTLGALIALYEHKVFVEGVLWDIDSFDQWGVELGKTLASKVLAELQGGEAGEHDASTAALIGRLKGS